ncbi:hypothetical protein RHSIM_Rhsim02G0179800 [Rhododendron simsii]|uniref:Retrotransposon Copia-like N-terminal domain-containing protein n=1 Tax=Rhododendron simsii TaxID=118357 RepID=A0A834HDC6_RHOSS|nr:hypothetical protein RHSIM_Rhsim02G0179800 [Rhododendron simsii]
MVDKDLVTSSHSSDSKEYENSSYPLYLHPSDQPGVMLVSQPLTSDNYTTWSCAIVMALSAKSKVGLIDGSILKPAKTDPLFNQWIHCNNMREIHDLTQDMMPVGTYFTKLKGMWDEVNALSPTPSCSCGAMTEILLMEPLPTINKVFSLLVQEERQRDIVSSIQIPEIAVLASKSNTKGQRNFKSTDKKKGGTRD